ncbi:MAG: glycoside hydrolase family 130 protein [Kiritimatiellae bacterium]|jgi:predicted GH43/DUF377 family glycosyl hydrolase|nr:glycoside hydrolase family 130 protein [Kiritimatiellia bacterium]
MDLACRFPENPLLCPADVRPSIEGAVVECLLNPGVFRWQGHTRLLLRVAERMEQEPGWLTTLVADPETENGSRIVRFRLDDPRLKCGDPRGFTYDGVPYLTTLSHFRIADSDDGVRFRVQDQPLLTGQGPLEAYGIEDVRVTRIGDVFHLTYSAASENGVGVALQTTRDWKTFNRHGLIFPPHNKDCALFEETIDGQYACLHRPVGVDLGGPFIWYATSPDLIHWGRHTPLIRTRPGMWDSQRVGAGAAPIRTKHGWLELYHAADADSRYCIGALLLDFKDPSRVLARSAEPIMEPLASYEQQGFYGNVVFTNGHVVDGDRIRVYYGASDEVVCGADFSLNLILETLL